MIMRNSRNNNKPASNLLAKLCKCDLTAVIRTVQREGPNHGRQFWTCPNSESARCGFFEWDDGSSSGTPGSAGSQFSTSLNSGNTTRGGGASNAGSGECFKVKSICFRRYRIPKDIHLLILVILCTQNLNELATFTNLVRAAGSLVKR